MRILVTGGAGYIGSHTAVELLERDYEVVIVDDFSNSKPEALKNIKQITSKDFKFYEADLLDREKLDRIFTENEIDVVIHFAGYKAVGESVLEPLKYYHNNIGSTVALCSVMQKHNVKKIVFSSSATVYGMPEKMPITEDFPLSATNPYGWTKFMIERILTDLYTSDNEWSISLLRYFNPVGAHESGLIGESPNGIPNNLMPYITQVATGKLKSLNVFGDDYDTIDGTGVRDYVHVVDLSLGHIAAVEHLKKGVNSFNLGTGKGTSVLQLVEAFEKANDIKIPYKIAPRRPGDIAVCYADTVKAENELKWNSRFDINRMCRDAWNFEKNRK